MSLKQTIYYMALVGGTAGLLCWFIQAFLSDLLTFSPESQWQQVMIYTSLLGALLGALTVAFGDRWTGDRVVPRWVFVGIALGVLAGVLTGLAYYLLFLLSREMDPGSAGALLVRILVWGLAGCFVGLFIGLRWADVNRLRAVHASIGGTFGGMVGGLLFSFLGSSDFFQALAFILSGMSISLGVTLAPVLFRDGVLLFVGSSDDRAQRKYGISNQQWFIQDGDSYLIGNEGSDLTQTLYSRTVQIFIPDSYMAPKHAVLFGEGGHFYLRQHPENADLNGMPACRLEVEGETLSGTRELRDGDRLVLGGTSLQFLTRKRSQR